MKLKTKFFILAAIMAWFSRDGLRAQQLQPVTSIQADCGVFFNLTGASTVIDNRQAQCDGWTVSYSSHGYTPVSVTLQDAPIGTNAGAAGTFVSWAGTILTGSTLSANPATATTQAEIRGQGYYPYVRVLVALTGTGFFRGTIFGWKTNPNTANISATLVGGCPNPCPVDGVTAAGSPPTTPPVLVAGQDGTNLQTLKTDTAGDLQTQLIGNGAVLSGQQAVTGAAVALATHAARAACVKALVSNSINVFVGPTGITTSTGYLLAPGEGVCLPVTNTNLLFVIASTTGASVSWAASN